MIVVLTTSSRAGAVDEDGEHSCTPWVARTRVADRSFVLARAVGIRLTLVAVESIHGVMRRLFSSRNAATFAHDS